MADMILKNNNRSIIKKLSTRSIKIGKMRNVFIILTIVISVALLSGLSLVGLSMGEVERKQVAGMQQVIYHETTLEQALALKADNRISELVLYKEGSRTEIENYMIITAYYQQIESSMQGIEIAEGNYPSNLKEVLVDKSYMKQIGREAVLGESLTFTFFDGTTESFVISGFTDTGATSKSYFIYFSEEYAINGSQMKNILYNSMAKIVNGEEMTKEVFLTEIRSIGADHGIERKQINENNIFVLSKTPQVQDVFMLAILGISILFVSILVVYSIFYISVINRIRQFGQLRTLGMTERQIKKVINMEGMILFLIGAPVGFLIGAVFAYMVRPEGWSWKTTGIIAVIALFADYITIRLSLKKPAKVAGSVSPIEASKISGYDGGAAESKEIYRKITPHSLAFMNFGRNKKKIWATLVSLGLGGIVFLIGTTFLNSFTPESYSRQGKLKFHEVIISFSENAKETNEYGLTGLQLENPMNDELISKIMNIEGVNEIEKSENLMVTYEYNDFQEKTEISPMSVKDMDALNRFQKKNTFDYENMIENKEILILLNDVADEIFGWHFKVGDTIFMRWYDGNQYCEDTFTIAGEVDTGAYSKMMDNEKTDQIFLNTSWFLMPDELMKKMMPENFNFNTNLMISTDWESKGTEITKVIDEMIQEEPALRCETLSEAIIEETRAYNQLFSLIMGLTVFIILFSIINLINTIVTNVMSRKQEFAMLQAIGLTDRQLVKMVQMEGFLFSIWNIVITFILGSILGYFLVDLMRETGASYLSWMFPAWYFLAYAIVVIIVPVMISYIAIKLFKSKTVVERLRETE